MLAGVSSTSRITCLHVSALIGGIIMKVCPVDFAELRERRFKIESVYGHAQSVQSWFVDDATHGIRESGERLSGATITRLEQFSKASSSGRGFARIEVSISHAMCGGIR